MFVKKYINASNSWYKAQPTRIKLLIFLFIIMGPSLLRFVVQHNSWATYTDKRYGYTLEYPAHLWKRVSYNGFPGKRREVHLLLAWPAFIDITHQIAVGTVELEEPTPTDVAAYYEDMLLADGWQIASDLEEIQSNHMVGLARTYTSSNKKYKQVYFAKGNRGYMLRFTAASMFYNSSLQDFNHTVSSFRVLTNSPPQ